MTIQEHAQELSQQLERRADDKYYVREDAKDAELLKRLAFAIDQNTSIASFDYQYEFLVDALQAVADADADDDYTDYLPEAVYTSEFTDFLAANDYHVEYLNRALQEYGTFDSGFDLLAAAYRLAQLDAADTVIGALQEGK